MIDRRNRVVLTLLGLLLLAGGALSACLGAGVFGTRRSDRTVFDPTVVRWWNEGGWKSFATVVGIGMVAALVGVWLVGTQLRANDRRGSRTPTMTLRPEGDVRGETTLRAPALSHSIERDLETIPEVLDATVRLDGTYPDIGMRALLDLSDDADLEQLPAQVDETLGRAATTSGVRLSPVHVTVRFKATDAPRQLA